MVRCTAALAWAALPLLASAAVPNLSGADLLDAIKDLPSCGLTCFTSTLQYSNCTGIDTDCFCTDQAFLGHAQECILEECSTLQALQITRIIADNCGQPRRNAKKKLLLQLIAEVPAFFFPWLRLWSSWKFQKRFSFDDYVMTAAGVFYTVFVVIGIWLCHYAFGEDIWYVDPDVVVTGLKWFYIDETFYLATLCLTKISVISFMLRIFTTPTFRLAAFSVMGFTTLGNLVVLFLQIFQCHPIHLVWDGWKDKEWLDSCLDLNTLAYAAASLVIVQDLAIIILPMPWLIKLQMNLKTKIGIMIMFSLGVFVLATSCARLSYILKFGHTVNPTMDYVGPIIWSGLEVAVSIMVACLPALRLLVLHYVPALGSLTTRVAGGTSKPSKRSSGYGKLSFGTSKSTGSKLQKSSRGMTSSGNESQVELGKSPFTDNSYEENGYHYKAPVEVKVAAENNIELQEHPHSSPPKHGIWVENEVTVGSEFTDSPRDDNRRFRS